MVVCGQMIRPSLVGVMLASIATQTVVGAEILSFEVTPAAPGRQMVRRSLPFAAGAWPARRSVVVDDGSTRIVPAVRVLTRHPADEPANRSVRRAIVTFPYDFGNASQPATFLIQLDQDPSPSRESRDVALDVPVRVGTVTASFDARGVKVTYPGAPAVVAKPVEPAIASDDEPTLWVIESNAHFLWLRYDIRDEHWRRGIEIRADSLGTVTLVQHLQRLGEGDGYAPEMGWRITTEVASAMLLAGDTETPVSDRAAEHSFEHEVLSAVSLPEAGLVITHPVAPLKRKGTVSASIRNGRLNYLYLRSAGETDKVPHQQAAWRKAEVVIAPASQATPTDTLESPHRYHVPPAAFDAAYGVHRGTDPLSRIEHPALKNALAYHHRIIPKMMLHGDDLGNITALGGGEQASVFGMNRLNHCPAILDEYYRSGDDALRRAAILWGENFYDLTIWWGRGRKGEYGGTRYNNANAMGIKTHLGDRSFMWRSNRAVHFCTKGFCSFLMFYEETGDPRMAEALDAQLAYARQAIHTDQGECRNIGDVYDFLRLYASTGEQDHREQAMRLFRELRSKLMPNDLFSQSGRPIHAGDEFIASDKVGYKFPFAKPYIIGYALAGLPELLTLAPNEPRLRGTVTAVADFLAESQDRTGGWRYPHPKSPGVILSQAVEHAWQLTRAGRAIGPRDHHLDAIERVLKLRIKSIERHGRCLGHLGAWEFAAGVAKSSDELQAMYPTFADRDTGPDYTQGALSFGTPIEGAVYFPEVLAWYLEHRPADRLVAPDAFLDTLITRAK